MISTLTFILLLKPLALPSYLPSFSFLLVGSNFASKLLIFSFKELIELLRFLFSSFILASNLFNSSSLLLDSDVAPAFFRAFLTADLIPLDENVAPETESTFVVCLEIIESISDFAFSKYGASSPLSRISIFVIFPSFTSTSTFILLLNPVPVPSYFPSFNLPVASPEF